MLAAARRVARTAGRSAVWRVKRMVLETAIRFCRHSQNNQSQYCTRNTWILVLHHHIHHRLSTDTCCRSSSPAPKAVAYYELLRHHLLAPMVLKLEETAMEALAAVATAAAGRAGAAKEVLEMAQVAAET